LSSFRFPFYFFATIEIYYRSAQLSFCALIIIHMPFVFMFVFDVCGEAKVEPGVE